MMIIGCDFHPSWQQVSWLDTETGETGERKLVQASGDAERFYRQVAAPALIGMEATGNCHWLVDLLSESRVVGGGCGPDSPPPYSRRKVGGWPTFRFLKGGIPRAYPA